jgi:hypothetical protein
MIDYGLRDPFLDHAGMIGPTTKWELNEMRKFDQSESATYPGALPPGP